MKREGYEFVELLDKIDARFVSEADGSWEKESKTSLFHSKGFRAACAVLCVSLGGVCLFQPQVQAAIQKFAGRIAQIWGTEKDLSPYTEVINQEQKKDGFTLTLNEVILSDSRIYAAVTVDSEYKDAGMMMDAYVTINGKDYDLEGCSVQGEQKEEQFEYELGYEERNASYLFIMSLRKNIPETVTDMELHFKIYKNFQDWSNGTDYVLFDFAFRTSKDELEKKVIHTPMDESFTLENGKEIMLTELTITALDSEIKAEMKNIPEAEMAKGVDMEYYLEGEDSLGNDVSYFCEGGEFDASRSGNVKFKSELPSGGLPSVDAEWIDLQLYTYRGAKEKETEIFDEGDDEELYGMEEDGSALVRVDLGEKFRVYLK